MLENLKEKYLKHAFLVIFLCAVAFSLYNLVSFSQKEKTEKHDEYVVSTAYDHYKIKNKEARVTIVNYFSLDCPYCKKLYDLEEDFLQTSPDLAKKLNIIYRHNPLAIQPLSQGKALIAECVYRQQGDEVFFKFVKRVFKEHQDSYLDNVWVKDIAYKMVPSVKDLDLCVHDATVQNSIQTQKNQNLVEDIQYTPTLLVFVDGVFIKKYENIGVKTLLEVIKYYANLK
jgi:thiol-disulfide isomerase/thioredoxin